MLLISFFLIVKIFKGKYKENTYSWNKILGLAVVSAKVLDDDQDDDKDGNHKHNHNQ